MLQSIYIEFREYLSDFKSLKYIAIPSCVLASASTMELHGFCDALERALHIFISFRCFENYDLLTLKIAKLRVAPQND